MCPPASGPHIHLRNGGACASICLAAMHSQCFVFSAREYTHYMWISDIFCETCEFICESLFVIICVCVCLCDKLCKMKVVKNSGTHRQTIHIEESTSGEIPAFGKGGQ